MNDDSESIEYEVKGATAIVALARPPVNALSLRMIRSVTAAFRRAASDKGVRVVLLGSAIPGRFSAGLDLDILLGRSGEEVREFVQDLYVALYDAQYNLGKPSIALVAGAARGGGMTMAISCDVLIASESATFGYPEIDVGVLPAIHFAYLPKLVGLHRAFELLFGGRTFNAEEARLLGLVSRVVPDHEIESCARDLPRFRQQVGQCDEFGRAAFMRQNDFDYRGALRPRSRTSAMSR